MNFHEKILSLLPKEQLEAILSQNAEASYEYALRHRQGRFELGEPVILKDPILSSLYAINVLKRRWPEAEEIISKSGKASYNYFMEISDYEVSEKIYKRIEKALLKQKGTRKILEYALALGGRLPESLHNRMLLEGNREYVNFLESSENSCILYLKTLTESERSDLLKSL